MGEPSPTLSHVNFELHNYIPPTLRSSSDAHRSGHDSVENLTTDGIFLDFGMDDTSHPTFGSTQFTKHTYKIPVVLCKLLCPFQGAFCKLRWAPKPKPFLVQLLGKNTL